MADMSASETRTEFEEQKRIVRELQDRLADAELQLTEGEKLRKKLHNTILVLICSPFIDFLLLLSTKLFFVAGVERKHSSFLSSATLVT